MLNSVPLSSSPFHFYKITTLNKPALTTEDFITIEKNEGIATIWMDHQKEKMNVVSPPIIQIFGDVFNQIEQDDDILAAILISKKKDFIAGADIKSFSIEKPGDFRPFQEMGHQSLARLENSKKPVVAAVHGACLGLGLEVALACHAIVSANDPDTKFALPEVRLGILPGGGGTQRLPRRVGIQKALDMMLTGKNIYAYQAKKMGLADALTHRDKLHRAATILAKKMLKKPLERKHKKKWTDRLLEDNSIGRSILFSQARKMALKQSQGNYPAIPAILDCVETSYNKGIKAGYQKELEHFEQLMLTPESKAMRQLFFDMSDNKKNPVSDKSKPLNTLGMIGAGFMGAGIAEVSINKDIDVLLKDINQETLSAAKKQIWKGLAKKIKYKSLTKTEAEEKIGRLQTQLDYDHYDNVDIVIEAVLERMDLKKRIIEDIEKHCEKEVIIATNTSSLSVTEMASHAQSPDQVIGMHYFSPVPKMPLLEIVKTEQTADWVIAACYDFGLRQGKTCIIVKDSPGFYVNRILAPYMNECLIMIEEGIDFVAIDKALKKKGFPVGPITLFDRVGLDIAAHVVGSSEKIVAHRPGFEISYGVVKMFEAGRLGKKNKKGFFLYDPKTGKKKGPDKTAYQFFKGSGNATLATDLIQDRALLLMLNEAVLCLEEGIIASPADGDLGAVFGIGFLPFTGGPFRYIDLLGAKTVVERMEELSQQFGPKFTPADTLREMAKEGKSFF